MNLPLKLDIISKRIASTNECIYEKFNLYFMFMTHIFSKHCIYEEGQGYFAHTLSNIFYDAIIFSESLFKCACSNLLKSHEDNSLLIILIIGLRLMYNYTHVDKFINIFDYLMVDESIKLIKRELILANKINVLTTELEPLNSKNYENNFAGISNNLIDDTYNILYDDAPNLCYTPTFSDIFADILLNVIPHKENSKENSKGNSKENSGDIACIDNRELSLKTVTIYKYYQSYDPYANLLQVNSLKLDELELVNVDML